MTVDKARKKRWQQIFRNKMHYADLSVSPTTICGRVVTAELKATASRHRSDITCNKCKPHVPAHTR